MSEELLATQKRSKECQNGSTDLDRASLAGFRAACRLYCSSMMIPRKRHAEHRVVVVPLGRSIGGYD